MPYRKLFVLCVGVLLLGVATIGRCQVSADSTGFDSKAFFQSPFPTSTPSNPDLVNGLNELVNYPNCNHPCWWGIQLGVSNRVDIQRLLHDYLGMAFHEGQDAMGQLIPDGDPLDEFRPYLMANLYFSESSISPEGINLRIGVPENAYVDYGAYTLSSVLSIYGQPDDILLVYPYGSGLLFLIKLRYDQLGLYINYTLNINDHQYPIREDKALNICDSDSISEIDIWAKLPDSSLESPQPEFEKGSFFEYSLSQITGLSNRQITQVLLQPNSCIELFPHIQWPDPAPTRTPKSIRRLFRPSP